MPQHTRPVGHHGFRLWGVLLLGSLALARGSAATTYYVQGGGSGGSSCSLGQSLSTPLATIAAGLTCLAAGDTLYLRAGTYTEANIVRAQGTPEQPVLIAGYPGDARPVVKSPPTATTDVLLVDLVGTGGANYLTIRDFDIDAIDQPINLSALSVLTSYTTIDNMTLMNAARNGMVIGEDTDHVVVRNTRILNCGRIQPAADIDTKGQGIYTIVSDSLFENNVIDGCRGGGFEINYDHNQRNIYRNNIVRNAGCASPWGCISRTWDQGTDRPTDGRAFNLGGTNFGPNGPTGNLIANNVMYNLIGTDGWGRCFGFWDGSGGGGTPNILVNNTCYNASVWTVVTCGGTHHAIIQNNLYADVFGTPTFCGTLTGVNDHNLTNPTLSATFVNAPGGNFRLPAGSPAIDQGVTRPDVPTDFCGVPRPQPPGGAYDLGAYEFGPCPTSGGAAVAWWKLNEGSGTSTADATGNSHTGTLKGTPLPTWHPGRIGPASLHFDGGGGYVEVPGTLGTPPALAMATWFQVPTGVTTRQELLSIGDSVGLYLSGGYMQCWYRGSGVGTRSVGQPMPTDGLAHHLVCSLDPAANSFKIYRDGTLLFSGTLPVPLAWDGGGTTTTLGRASATASNPYTGTLDDTRVYNYQPSDAEVSYLYRSTGTPPRHRGSLVR